MDNGDIIYDKDNGRSKEELSPPQIREKESKYVSLLRSRRPPKLRMHRKVPQRSEKGGGARP